MMEIILFLLSLLLTGNAELKLIDSDWRIRQQAHRQLEKKGFLGLPSVILASRSEDIEAQHRARQLKQLMRKRYCGFVQANDFIEGYIEGRTWSELDLFYIMSIGLTDNIKPDSPKGKYLLSWSRHKREGCVQWFKDIGIVSGRYTIGGVNDDPNDLYLSAQWLYSINGLRWAVYNKKYQPKVFTQW